VDLLRGVAGDAEGKAVEKKGRLRPDPSAGGEGLADGVVVLLAIEVEGAEVEFEMGLRGGIPMDVEMAMTPAQPETLVEVGLTLFDGGRDRVGCGGLAAG
jgi:hypothetical protein